MSDPSEPSESTYYRRLKRRRLEELEEASGGNASEHHQSFEDIPDGTGLDSTPASPKQPAETSDLDTDSREGAAELPDAPTSDDNLLNQYDTAPELEQLDQFSLFEGDREISSDGDNDHREGEGSNNDRSEEEVNEEISDTAELNEENNDSDRSREVNEENSDSDRSREVNEENSDSDRSEYEEDEENEVNHTSNLGDCNLDTVVNLTSGTRARDILLLTFGLSVRHNWSYENIIDHLTCQNTLLDLPCLPQSKEKLWKIISHETSEIQYHAYCGSCQTYLGLRRMLNFSSFCKNDTCKAVILRSMVKYFITLSLRKQLERFLSLPKTAEQLQYPHVREKRIDDPNSLEDIFDGAEYKRLVKEKIVDPEKDFTYIFNGDGVKIGKGAHSAHPLYIRLNELHPNLRQKHLFLAAVWVDRQEPDMNCFLKPFVDEANDLSSKGIVWKPDGKNDVVSKFIPLGQCVDSKERWTLFNMTQFNGKFGCVVCEVNGKWSANNMRYPVLPPHGTTEPKLRTEKNLVADMIAAHNSHKVIKGVKGVSVLMNLKHFRMVNGCGMDDLHTLYEGCAKHHTDLLMSLKGTTTFAVRVTIINERLKSMKTPSSISRKLGNITKRSSWKGSMWRNWLLFYCCVCMKDLIPQKYLDHIALLSHATFLMSQDAIHPESLETIHSLLVKYVKLFERYFGIDHMFYNHHLLLHFKNCIINLGPLWCYSTFNFESWNRKCICEHVHSPKGEAQQIAYRHLIKSLVHYYMHSGIDVSASTVEQLMRLLQKTRTITHSVGHIHFLGAEAKRQPTEPERALLEEAGYVGVETSYYTHILHKSVLYSTSSSVNSNALSDDSVVYTWEDSICTIDSFVTFVCGNVEVSGAFVWEHYVDSLDTANHIANVTSDERIFHFVRVHDIRCPVVHMKVGREKYFGVLANCYEID